MIKFIKSIDDLFSLTWAQYYWKIKDKGYEQEYIDFCKSNWTDTDSTYIFTTNFRQTLKTFLEKD